MKLTESQVVLGDNDKIKCMFTASSDKHFVKLKMRLHMAKHILSMNNGPYNQNCGYCGRIGYCNISIETLKHGTRIPSRIAYIIINLA